MELLSGWLNNCRGLVADVFLMDWFLINAGLVGYGDVLMLGNELVLIEILPNVVGLLLVNGNVGLGLRLLFLDRLLLLFIVGIGRNFSFRFSDFVVRIWGSSSLFLLSFFINFVVFGLQLLHVTLGVEYLVDGLVVGRVVGKGVETEDVVVCFFGEGVEVVVQRRQALTLHDNDDKFN